jgi:hypothetical protein
MVNSDLNPKHNHAKYTVFWQDCRLKVGKLEFLIV